MAGRIPTKAQIAAALKEYLAKTAGVSCGYSEADDIYELKDANGKEATIGPGWQCSDKGLLAALSEIIMDSGSSENALVRVAPSGKNAAQAIQTMQAGKDLMYQVAKKPAPTATMALMAATDAKIDLQELNAVLTDELASSTIRAKRKDGRSVDATVSIRKADFINLLAWREVDEQEKVKNFILDDSDPLNIALPNGFPRIKPDAQVNIRVSDKTSSKIEKRRAIVHIYIEAMQQWIFQQRQCQTKAKRNAIIQALTSSGDPMETMDEEELQDEARECEMVGA